MSGKTTYRAGENGQVTFSFNPNSFNCGRVQVDAAYRNINGSGEGEVFLGEVIDYGVDCGTTVTPPGPEPTRCVESAALTATQVIPARITTGSTVPFEISIFNSGETWFYHGMYFQLHQTTAQAINPFYGHLSPSMRPGDIQQKPFSLVAPTTPGTYTISFQMVHRVGAEYKKGDGAICAPAPTSDVYFGNKLSMTFEVYEEAIIQSGTVIVTSNVPTTWTVTGPQNFSGSGTYGSYNGTVGAYGLSNVPSNIQVGSAYYELKEIAPTGTQALASNAIIAFQVTYQETVNVSSPRITLSSNARCGELKLTWEDLSNNENGFHIYRSTEEHNGDYTKYQRIATVAANTTFYTDRPEVNKSYYYIVAAYINSPSRISTSNAHRSDFVRACTAQIEGAISIVAINGSQDFKVNDIKDGDFVTVELLVDNLGPSDGYITKITNELSGTLIDPRNLTVTGINSVVTSPAITGSHPNVTFNVSGRKEVGGVKWAIRFDATVKIADDAISDQLSSCSTIHYFDEQGDKTKRVCLTTLIAKNANGGGLRFREVAN
jgi:hypothetical protein